jgi:hypothetical protein
LITPGAARARAGLIIAAAVAAASAGGCASMGMPPGGPPDTAAPTLVKVTPESGTVRVTPRAVEFTFDEVVSERGRGAQGLEGLVVISPSTGRPDVNWGRNKLVIRPRGGWRPNTAYSVTLLPGLADLRSNATKQAFHTVFATGDAIPSGAIRGVAFDWMAGKQAPLARVDAVIGPDTTLRYRIAADSVGRFTLGTLPAAAFTVRAWLDANANGVLDPREPWDTATIALADSARHDFYLLPHDTLGARISELAVADSETIRVKFDHGLRGALTAAQVTVMRMRDSSQVPVRAVLPFAARDSVRRQLDAARDDSALRADTTARGRQALARRDSLRLRQARDSAAAAQIDSLRALRDTVKREPPPKLARPVPPTEFAIELGEAIAGGEAVRVTVTDAQAVVGPARTSDRTTTRPRPAPRDTTPRPPAPPHAPLPRP